MNKQEIVQHIANVHNGLAQVMVCGDSAILMGSALQELRYVVQGLQKDIEAEEAAFEASKGAPEQDEE